MADREIENRPTAILLAEIASVKLILRAILEGALPQEKSERWAEIEAMVSMIENSARRSTIMGAGADDTKQIMKVAQELAVNFVRGLSPKF
jgi:hypothetical protein